MKIRGNTNKQAVICHGIIVYLLQQIYKTSKKKDGNILTVYLVEGEKDTLGDLSSSNIRPIELNLRELTLIKELPLLPFLWHDDGISDLRNVKSCCS